MDELYRVKIIEHEDIALMEDISIVIPTLNSEMYISLIADYYENLGLNPYYFVDQKTSDRTFEVLTARSQRVFAMRNETAIIEGKIEEMSRASPTNWVLRIDDDELPSAGLFDYALRAIKDDRYDIFGFIRHQCGVTSEGALMAHVGHQANLHRQNRLYRKGRVTFRSDIHSAGFYLDGLRVSQAPDKHCFIHLDWVVRSYLERERKIMNYNLVEPNAGDKWKSYYLPEDELWDSAAFEKLENMEFEKIAISLARRLPHNTIKTHARQPNEFEG